jgi:hypothetical protein
MTKKKVLGLALIGLVAALCLAPEGVLAKRVGVGNEFYVSSRHLPLHEQPTGFSRITGSLTFGAEVKIIDVTDFENQSNITGKDVDPAWALVESGGLRGYVPTRAIVRKRVLNRQDPNRAIQKMESREATTTGKSFSETENADLQAMKGVAGKSKAGVADEAGIDAVLAAPQENNPQTAYAEFRKEGKLGEFQEAR